MSNKSKKTNQGRGRPSAIKSETLQEEYVKIWCAKFFLKKSIFDLMKEFNCSKNKIKIAITFINNEFIKIPNEVLLKGAIFSLQERIKRMTAQLEKEYDEKEPSVRNLKEMNSEIRNDEIELHKLQSLYEEKYSVTLEAGGSIKAILKEIAAKNNK